MPVFRTLAAPHQVEIPKIKGSRFIADVAPVASEAEAKAFVESVRQVFPDASHHCWAWALAGDVVRSSDDGEPGGTAGEPILKRILGAELEAVAVVVTRWFGGTKLGMGGLVRAYGGAAAAVLDEAEIVTRTQTVELRLSHAYGDSGAVTSVLTAHGLEPVSAEYGVEVVLAVAVPVEEVDVFVIELRDRTAGRVVAEPCADPG